MKFEYVADDVTRRNFDTIERLLGVLGEIQFFTGSGTPEGVVTASPGAIYFNRTGGAGVSIYVKETLTGNTGWIGK